MSARRISVTDTLLPPGSPTAPGAPAWLEDVIDVAVAAGVFLTLALILL
jgi:hypothetical protein